jgi:hypothetical protein
VEEIFRSGIKGIDQFRVPRVEMDDIQYAAVLEDIEEKLTYKGRFNQLVLATL